MDGIEMTITSQNHLCCLHISSSALLLSNLIKLKKGVEVEHHQLNHFTEADILYSSHFTSSLNSLITKLNKKFVI
jgi:hypothetical protein